MRSNLLIFWSILLVALVQDAFSQATEITKTDFTYITDRGFTKMESGPYRVKRTYIRKGETEEGDVISETTEYQTMERWRSISILRSGSGTKQEEHRRVNGRDFRRTGKGKWKELKADGTGKAFTVMGGRMGSEVKETEIYRRLEDETINGEVFRVFESLRSLVSGSDVSEYYLRFWVPKDGRIRRAESRSTHDGIITDHTMSEYEIDPNIRVRIPIR